MQGLHNNISLLALTTYIFLVGQRRFVFKAQFIINLFITMYAGVKELNSFHIPLLQGQSQILA
jgi:hypothetical protein